MMAHTVTGPSGSSDPKTGQSASPRPGLWKGRAAILIGLVLLGIGVRHAVTGLSPLLSDVRETLGIGTAGATLIGMLPTLCFGDDGPGRVASLRTSSSDTKPPCALYSICRQAYRDPSDLSDPICAVLSLKTDAERRSDDRIDFSR